MLSASRGAESWAAKRRRRPVGQKEPKLTLLRPSRYNLQVARHAMVTVSLGASSRPAWAEFELVDEPATRRSVIGIEAAKCFTGTAT